MDLDELAKRYNDVIIENKEMLNRLAELEHGRDESRAQVERLKANNSALRARIQELEGASEVREDGEPETTPFDWIDPTVHAEAMQELRTEVKTLEIARSMLEARVAIAEELLGEVVMHSVQLNARSTGSALVTTVQLMRREQE